MRKPDNRRNEIRREMKVLLKRLWEEQKTVSDSTNFSGNLKKLELQSSNEIKILTCKILGLFTFYVGAMPIVALSGHKSLWSPLTLAVCLFCAIVGMLIMSLWNGRRS